MYLGSVHKQWVTQLRRDVICIEINDEKTTCLHMRIGLSLLTDISPEKYACAIDHGFVNNGFYVYTDIPLESVRLKNSHVKVGYIIFFVTHFNWMT